MDVTVKTLQDPFRLAIDTIPALAWSSEPNGYVDFLNQRWREYTGLTHEQAQGWGWQAAVLPEDLPGLLEVWKGVLQSSEPGEVEARLRRFDGIYRWFLFRAMPLHDEHGQVIKWYGTTTDIHSRKWAEQLLAGEKHLLEMIAGTDSLHEILEHLCRLVEDTATGSLCSILLVDPTGTRLKHGAATSLPRTYVQGIDDIAVIALGVGPCASAAFLRAPVVAIDFELEDDRWPDHYRARALAHGLRACWSTPIFSQQGVLLGTFAVYYREPGSPTSQQQALIEQFTHIASIAIDRRRTELALHESEERFRQMADAIPEVIWIIDLEPERVLYVSPSFERIWGLSVAELYRNPRLWTETIHPEDRTRVRSTFSQWVANNGSGPYNVEFRIVQPGGGVRWIHERGVLVLDEDGKARRVSGISTDVTERKRADDELRRSESHLAEAQRLSLTGSFSWVVATNELMWSEETYRIYELDPAQPISFELVRMRIHPDDVPMFNQTAERASREGGDFMIEHRLLMPDGSIKFLHVVAHALMDVPAGLEYVGAVRDVTERKHSDDALHEVRSHLTRVARVSTLGELTASIAHEVNQPLAGIITNANTCLRQLATVPPMLDEARETAQRTIRDGKRAADVIARVQALFRKTALADETVDLNEAIGEVIALARSEVNKSRVTLRTELAADLPSVVGDRVQLQQVILNLILNGLEAMIGVKGRPRELVIRTCAEGGEHVRVEVGDSGEGFNPANAERMFGAFYTTKSGGMGIGLSVSRSIVESHRGRLQAVLNDAHGATFQVTLPRRP